MSDSPNFSEKEGSVADSLKSSTLKRVPPGFDVADSLKSSTLKRVPPGFDVADSLKSSTLKRVPPGFEIPETVGRSDEQTPRPSKEQSPRPSKELSPRTRFVSTVRNLLSSPIPPPRNLPAHNLEEDFDSFPGTSNPGFLRKSLSPSVQNSFPPIPPPIQPIHMTDLNVRTNFDAFPGYQFPQELSQAHYLGLLQINNRSSQEQASCTDYPPFMPDQLPSMAQCANLPAFGIEGIAEAFSCMNSQDGYNYDTRTYNESLSRGVEGSINATAFNQPVIEIPQSENLLKDRVIDLANRILLMSEENISLAGNSNFSISEIPDDISIEYWNLYAKSRPENYDFAMNMMAYVEILNDSSWKMTVSYFDENVKRMASKIWNTNLATFNSEVRLETYDREMTLKLMSDYTRWSLNEDFSLEKYFNYCVVMCHLGVIARKNIFKEAPLHAIGELRNRIKLFKFEDFAEFMFQIVVKNYAKKQCMHGRI